MSALEGVHGEIVELFLVSKRLVAVEVVDHDVRVQEYQLDGDKWTPDKESAIALDGDTWDRLVRTVNKLRHPL